MQYAGALLYLVPVVVAAIVAYVVTRTDSDRPEPQPPAPARHAMPFGRRARDRASSVDQTPLVDVPLDRLASGRRQPSSPAHPTLLHAALSSHLMAVSGTDAGAPRTGSRAANSSARRTARLVSIRRPARIPRRPSHLCPHKPE